MKSLILTDSLTNGGAERVASLLVNGLISQHTEVHICIFENKINYDVNLKDAKVHLLSKKDHFYIINILIRIWNLSRVIKSIKPDVIYSFGPIMATYIFMAQKISGTKIKKKVVSERNDPRFEPVSNVKKIIRDFCYNHSDVLVCQTPMAVDLLKGRGIRTKTLIIPNPIYPNLPDWQGLESKEIITAGRLTAQKNIPLLIKAFAKLNFYHPGYKLFIYGDGELKFELKKIIEELKLNDSVLLLGFSNNIHQIMSRAYMYVSSSDYEGISNSMLEAMAIGLPCICTDCPVGGAALNIKNGQNGFLVETGNEEDLYQKMNILVTNKELAKQFSRNSKEIRAKYSLPKITKRWMDL